MPTFDLVKTHDAPDSFRVAKVLGQFELPSKHVEERFKGDMSIEDESWSIGVIYGASGTGKSTIAKELFPKSYIKEFEYRGGAVIDDMPQDKSVEEITSTFNSVGFSTVWSWLKPYVVLSTGEKMRVDLARAILENKEEIVFDEYTSVVNREVAKIASFALQKTVRRLGKRFVAVTCHNDVIDWLEPDWVFSTDEMKLVKKSQATYSCS